MPRNKPTMRYRVELSRMFPGMWQVIDVFTGLPGEIGGFVSDCMSDDEAADMVQTMNIRDFTSRGIKKLN